ncbi:tRNA (adenosine(37)-N6)-dimethylallyltransferase MiaA, partial [Xanthomonas citri pv. citri]|nr:tRNA (adenosine(37)-N6)-dimethylallyltransferase MiaA [Xanthomonas citri pv. citri]
VELAKHFKTEIVSADSMQIYKNMDIATAKPTVSEKQDIVHHMMDFISTDKEYSVADYVSDAHKILVDIYSRNMIPIVVGGT